MVPTLTATPGVKDHRPAVGARGCERPPYGLAVVHVVTAAPHANTPDGPKDAKGKAGPGGTRRTRAAFAAHLRHVARARPASANPRAVPVTDNAPRHRGKAVG